MLAQTSHEHIHTVSRVWHMRMCFMCSRKCRFCNPRPYIRCCNALLGLCGWNERLADKMFRFSPHFKWLCLFNNPSVLIHRIWLWTGLSHTNGTNEWKCFLHYSFICVVFFYQNSKRNVPTIHFSEHWTVNTPFRTPCLFIASTNSKANICWSMNEFALCTCSFSA